MERQPRGASRRRLYIMIVASLAVHALAFVGLGLIRMPVVRDSVRRGEPMMVELRGTEPEAPHGNPAAHGPAPGPPAPARPATLPARPRGEARRQAAAPSPALPATPAPPPATPPRDVTPPEPSRTASAPAPPVPQPSPSRPVEDKREPSAKPADVATKAPAPNSESRPREAAPPSSAETRVATETRGEAGGSGDRNGAPAGGRAAPDVRTALRAGGGGGSGGGPPGGRGHGRGGIEGEPIPLDSTDGNFNEYLDRIRRMIKQNWGFPCVKAPTGHDCEYRSTQLIVEFGILKNGKLQFVDVVQSSGFDIYDAYAVNAIKLAAPFPDVPSAMMLAMRRSSTGVAILARFSYVVETSLNNILR